MLLASEGQDPLIYSCFFTAVDLSPTLNFDCSGQNNLKKL